MNKGVPSRDAAAIPLWDGAYDATRLGGQANLWGDPPVPHAEKAARLFARHGASVVLDLPCGDGRNLPPLAAGAPVLLAGDTSANAMAIAERVAAGAGVRDRVVFVRTDAFDTGLLPDSVDGIFSWDLLGHLTDPGAALREFHRVLRPGGAIVANMWTMNDCQVSDPNIREVAPKEYIDHFDFYCRFYDRSDLDELLESVGMITESVETASWWEPPHAGYREYEHEHESLIFTIRKAVA
ncbi:class I SAM-dependent methyltransferase [Longispora fulva]|uniref:class I SAM-dependent methyltransferase n=1 Tax=Longispora fulva TaxID=619741 RepID=UPI0018CAE4AA|nr:class I SAM-dependent methyltransferase [Longispora fulva]